jgi:hypothetical protein
MARRKRSNQGIGLVRTLNLLAFLPLAGRAPMYGRLLWALVLDPRVPASRKALEKAVFLKAPFWRSEPEGRAWRQSRIVNGVDEVYGWLDQDGCDPRSEESNTIQTRKASEVLRVLRNALAHGNLVYLDRDGQEIAGNQMVYMAFLSRYEETAAQREQAETYRVVITTEEAFLEFVKSWAEWIGSLDLDRRLAVAA